MNNTSPRARALPGPVSRQGALSISALAAVALLAGCGGGVDVAYDDPPPIPSPPPFTALDRAAGFYSGRMASGRDVSVIVLETGRLYALYGPVAPAGSTAIEGVLTGDGSASGSTFTSNTLHDVNFARQTSTPVGLGATFGFSDYFDATLAYAGGGTDAWAADYSTAYEYFPALTNVYGTYTGQLASLGGGVDAAVAVVSSSGAVSVTTPGGCNAAGTLYPHAIGNVYDLTLTYGARCAAAGYTLTGHAKYDGLQRSLVGVTTSSDFYDVALFVGTRP